MAWMPHIKKYSSYGGHGSRPDINGVGKGIVGGGQTIR